MGKPILTSDQIQELQKKIQEAIARDKQQVAKIEAARKALLEDLNRPCTV